MYQVVFSKQARKKLRKMPGPDAQRIRGKLDRLAQDPYAANNNVTKLQNRDGYRLRVGDWRILYAIYDDRLVILVVKIASRGEIYR